jgi:hypothetical protein
MVDESTAAATAPAADKKKGKAKGKAKVAAKGKAKAKAKKATAGSRSSVDTDAKITVVAKETTYRGKREKAFKALKTGMSYGQALDAIEKVYGYRTGVLLAGAVEAGEVKVAKAAKG